MPSEQLKNLRAELDELNLQLLELIEQRFEILDQVVAAKKNGGLEAVDSTRRESMLSLIEQTQNEKWSHYTLPIFKELIAQCERYVSDQL